MGDPNTVGAGERGSWGKFQWNRMRLHQLKMKYGDKWRTDAAQNEYFADEAEGKIPGGTSVKGWKSVPDLSRAGEISHEYEVYGDNSTGTRIGNARKWLRAYLEAHGGKAPPPATAGAPTAGAPAAKQHMSMNNMSNFQMDKGVHVKVSNPASANVQVQSAQLGALKGSFA
jgi:hypothetical protein